MQKRAFACVHVWFITLTEENEKKRLARGPEWGGGRERLSQKVEREREERTSSLNERLCVKHTKEESQSFVDCRYYSVSELQLHYLKMHIIP